MAVQYCRNGLSDWAGSDSMQIHKAGLAANLYTVSVVGWHINHALINDSVSAVLSPVCLSSRGTERGGERKVF